MNSLDSMTDLPSHIVANIFSRLPTKTIIHCRCVCKTWRNLLSEPYFANLHLSRSPTNLMIHQFGLYPEGDNFKLIEIEDEPDHHALHHDPIMKFEPRVGFPNSEICLVGSVNGLLCLRHGNHGTCMFNPITREFVILPMPKIIRKSYSITVYGFGMSSVTGHYKVVRIFQGDFPGPTSWSGPYTSECEVYTLGSGAWRSLGRVPFFVDGRQNGALVEGRLHWLIADLESPEMIYGFDIERESFELVPSPPQFNRDTLNKSLGVLRGCLCLCDNSSDSELVIWVMKDYGVRESWTKEIVIGENSVWGWLLYEMAHLLKVLKDGSILMLWRDDCLFTYHPETKTLEKLDQICGPDFEAMVYVPSFLSLRNLLTAENVEVF